MVAEEIEKRWCDRCGKRVKEDAQIDDTGQLLCGECEYLLSSSEEDMGMEEYIGGGDAE